METKLQQYFPMIKTRQELEKEIRSDQRLSDMFAAWNEEQKKE